MKYSVTVLLEEKSEDFSQFVQLLCDIFSSRREPFEILVMANGLEGFLKDELAKMENFYPSIKAFAFNKKTTLAVCLKAAVNESRGEIIVACGSYQQITRGSFEQLLDSFDDEIDIISPWRQKRVDPWFNQLQSKVFNILVKLITKSNLNDLSCKVRIFRREVLEETELYGNMYPYLPIVAAQRGFKYKEVKCEHFQERGKTGFYRLSMYLERILDIFTLYFNVRFTRKPLRFFSTIGAAFFIIGLIFTVYIFAQRVLFNYPVGDRPALLLSIVFMVLGTQAASVGLLGEIIAFSFGRGKKEYTVEKII